MSHTLYCSGFFLVYRATEIYWAFIFEHHFLLKFTSLFTHVHLIVFVLYFYVGILVFFVQLPFLYSSPSGSLVIGSPPNFPRRLSLYPTSFQLVDSNLKAMESKPVKASSLNCQKVCGIYFQSVSSYVPLFLVAWKQIALATSSAALSVSMGSSWHYTLYSQPTRSTRTYSVSRMLNEVYSFE